MAGGDTVSVAKGPKEAYLSLVEKGVVMTQTSSPKLLMQSFYAGCYIGFGALLATEISGNMKGLTADNPGLESLVFAALFPVNLMLILQSGGILYTGTAATCPAAIFEGKASVRQTGRCLMLSWVGNLLGSLCFAYFTLYCGLLEGPAAETALHIARKKVSKEFGITLAKGIGCNWMVCMAVFLQSQAQDMCGKYLSIWLPISAFVMIGFEHAPANFYLMIVGVMCGSKEQDNVTLTDVVLKNWIPVSIGNLVAGALIVAGGYSYAFGRLGGGDSKLGAASVEGIPMSHSDSEAMTAAKALGVFPGTSPMSLGFVEDLDDGIKRGPQETSTSKRSPDFQASSP